MRVIWILLLICAACSAFSDPSDRRQNTRGNGHVDRSPLVNHEQQRMLRHDTHLRALLSREESLARYGSSLRREVNYLTEVARQDGRPDAYSITLTLAADAIARNEQALREIRTHIQRTMQRGGPEA